MTVRPEGRVFEFQREGHSTLPDDAFCRHAMEFLITNCVSVEARSLTQIFSVTIEPHAEGLWHIGATVEHKSADWGAFQHALTLAAEDDEHIASVTLRKRMKMIRNNSVTVGYACCRSLILSHAG